MASSRAAAVLSLIARIHSVGGKTPSSSVVISSVAENKRVLPESVILSPLYPEDTQIQVWWWSRYTVPYCRHTVPYCRPEKCGSLVLIPCRKNRLPRDLATTLKNYRMYPPKPKMSCGFPTYARVFRSSLRGGISGPSLYWKHCHHLD